MSTLPNERHSLDPNKITASKTNPRKTNDSAALEELTASVREHGVLQPITVRVLEDERLGNKELEYEVVLGERRWRAAKAAGIRVPAFIVEIPDRDVLELQTIENLQREDLHPIEEAEGFDVG